MINRVGYACINNSLKPRGFQECRLSSIYKQGIDYLRSKIINNLQLTKEILEWNVENEIFMYRATSNLLPLVGHPEILRDFHWRWEEDQEIRERFDEIKNIVQKNRIRLSLHADQFMVLNSLNEKVVDNSIKYLIAQYQQLILLGGVDIIIHTGGVYGDKNKSLERFINVFRELPEGIQRTLRLENDDISFNLDDVLYVNEKTGIPIVLDVHHHRCNMESEINHQDIIKINEGWKDTGLIPKMHISSGKSDDYDKRHSDYIAEDDITAFIDLIGDIDVDLMVEAKEKEQAALNLIKFVHSKILGEKLVFL